MQDEARPDALPARLRRVRAALTPSEWARVTGMLAVVALLLAVGLALLFAASAHHYRLSSAGVFGIGTGMLALTLGVRHAFDADHIAAIDSTTRKLMAEGQRPVSVGFFFSLGHSTVVFVLAALLNLGIRSLDGQVGAAGSGLHRLTDLIGTSVSGVFLYLIAALNAVVLLSIARAFRQMRRGRWNEEDLDRMLEQRGLMNRFFGPLAKKVDRPSKMYLIGLVFGLGFDTATEVALLVMSGTAVASGLPFWAILSLPLLFAGGMCLFDTADGCFMNFAYGWAFSHPVRKVYYNLVVTGLSVAVAFVIGSVELLGLLGSELGFHGQPWASLASFNVNTAGFVLVGLFVATWLVALAVWRWSDFESAREPALADS